MIKVPDLCMQSVVFLCTDETDDDNKIVRTPQATGFFVSVPLTQDVWIEYLVTARHCIEMAIPYGKLYVRCNLKTGVYKDIVTSPKDWYYHPLADVAAIPIPCIKLDKETAQSLDHKGMMLDFLIDNPPHYDYDYSWGDETQRMRPDVGHDVCFVGLFSQHHGQEKNLPIARFGHIAMMPSRVRMKLPNDIEFNSTAYLIECQAWGGNSGSPVFSMFPILLRNRYTLGKTIVVIKDVTLSWSFKLLGILNAHYPNIQKSKAVNKIYKDEIEVKTDLNSGIAVVTPAEAIRELLIENEELKEQRDKLLKDHEKNMPMPILDFRQPEVFTQQDFEDALKKVSRRVKPEKSAEG